MFRFDNPQYLYLLLIIPVLVGLFWLNRRVGRKRLLRLGKPQYVKRLMADVSEKRVWAKFCLLVGALAFVVLALARPQMGMRLKADQMDGIEVVVAMDVSNSMMATDVSPTRLDKAKQVVLSLCNRLKNDKIALVVFAGNAFLQMPMSADNVSVSMFLDDINTGMIPVQGTSIAEALNVSLGAFSTQKDVKRAVVVITDGEDHEGGVDDALASLKKKGVQVYVMGIGSTKGSPIRMGNDYLRDENGEIVITRLNEQMCQRIAKAANGSYIHIDNSNSAQDELVDDLNRLQRTNLQSDAYEEYNDLFPWMIMVALILLVVEVIVQPRRTHYFDSWHLFSVRPRGGKTVVLLLAVMMIVGASCQSPTNTKTAVKVQTNKGNIAFRKKADSLSVIHYKKALAMDSMGYKAHYNLGNSYFRQNKAEEAVNEYEKSIMCNPPTIIKAAAYHNIGVINQSAQRYDEAIEAYKNSLRAFPRDDRTRYNLALCQKLRKNSPNQNQQQKNQQQNQDKQQDKQNQQQNQQGQQQSPQQQQNQQQQNQSQRDDMSKQSAEQMLRAVQMMERDTQQKLKRKRVPATRRRLEKNW